MEAYRAAIVGVGRIGFSLGFDKKREQPASHTFALEQNKRVRLVAACDTCRENLDTWERHTRNTKVYENLADMLAAETYDIVVVAVNEESHLSVMQEVLEAKPRLVILEKPVATSVASANLIHRKARDNNVPVMINHERRFAADYTLAKKLFPEIGLLQSIRASLCSGLRVYSESDEETGHYSLIHDGTHLVDIVSFLLDEKPGIPTINSFFAESDRTIRNVEFSCGTPAGKSISFYISGRSRFFAFELDILGTEGRIRIGNGFLELHRRRESSLYTGFYSLEQDKSVRRPRKTGYFSNMVAHAVDFLDGRTPLRSTIEDGIDDLVLLEQVRDCLKESLRKSTGV